MASRLIILSVAVAAAGGAGYIAKNMASTSQEVAMPEPEQPALALSEVLVLSADVPMGAAVDGQLTWQAWPTNAVDANFITRDGEADAIDKLKGSLARIAMYRGEPLRRSKLIGEGQSFMSSILPAGKRAIATQIAADTSAGGFILPNDFVDVIMTRRSQASGGEGFITETILKNIRVLAIDQAIQEDEEGKKVKVGQTATLELTSQQSEIITVAQQMADRLTLALRSTADAQEKPDGEADYLVSGNGRRGTVRLIKSGEVSEVGARR
ncbi:pilus assembly protein CpaB [Mesorhizobium albiziae]|uniref:Pilus assembly protein CpaB n=1 Tax=Neomesorhizobium albiziae TaxID=335020 RepID=A0A1I3WIC7_9HYPH|nr:Flp pilus assembly protein CpaB [Mesorhizobium albiziae]GLS31586.1 Flp pilus assembly protein CpaB [Mesorhizobium albiziae]SFK06231.1 pilus assembly protein CpaB [Mesorhizobium albiziae]